MPDASIIAAIAFIAGITAGWYAHRHFTESTAEVLENALHHALNSSIRHSDLTEDQAQTIYDQWMDVSGLSDVKRKSGVLCGCGSTLLDSHADKWLDRGTDTMHTTKWCDTVNSSR